VSALIKYMSTLTDLSTGATGPPNATEGNFMVRQFLASPKLPLRFYLAAGTFEIDRDGGGGNILESTRYLRDVLLAKGYQVHYQQFVGGHDGLSWRGRSLTASSRCSEFTKVPRNFSPWLQKKVAKSVQCGEHSSLMKSRPRARVASSYVD
jgi:hypothetical protein